MNYVKLKGWVNIHVSAESGETNVSYEIYDSMEEARKGILTGGGWHKVACVGFDYELTEEAYQDKLKNRG